MLGFQPNSTAPISTAGLDIEVYPVGVFALAETGDVNVITDQILDVTGIAAISYLGDAVAQASANVVIINGVLATTYIGNEHVWSQLDEAQQPQWGNALTNTFEFDEGPMFGGASISSVPYSTTINTVIIIPNNSWQTIDDSNGVTWTQINT